MRISIFGLGYVGAVTAGCLARRRHSIIGVDVQPQKVESFNAGIPPIVEPELEGLLRGAKEQGLLEATISAESAVCETDLSIVCVGTPSKVTGGLDLTYVRGVVQERPRCSAHRPSATRSCSAARCSPAARNVWWTNSWPISSPRGSCRCSTIRSSCGKAPR